MNDHTCHFRNFCPGAFVKINISVCLQLNLSLLLWFHNCLSLLFHLVQLQFILLLDFLLIADHLSRASSRFLSAWSKTRTRVALRRQLVQYRALLFLVGGLPEVYLGGSSFRLLHMSWWGVIVLHRHHHLPLQVFIFLRRWSQRHYSGLVQRWHAASFLVLVPVVVMQWLNSAERNLWGWRRFRENLHRFGTWETIHSFCIGCGAPCVDDYVHRHVFVVSIVGLGRSYGRDSVMTLVRHCCASFEQISGHLAFLMQAWGWTRVQGGW